MANNKANNQTRRRRGESGRNNQPYQPLGVSPCRGIWVLWGIFWMSSHLPTSLCGFRTLLEFLKKYFSYPNEFSFEDNRNVLVSWGANGSVSLRFLWLTNILFDACPGLPFLLLKGPKNGSEEEERKATLKLSAYHSFRLRNLKRSLGSFL